MILATGAEGDMFAGSLSPPVRNKLNNTPVIVAYAQVRILGPNYVPGKKTDLWVKNVLRTVIMMGPHVQAVPDIPAGVLGPSLLKARMLLLLLMMIIMRRRRRKRKRRGDRRRRRIMIVLIAPVVTILGLLILFALKVLLFGQGTRAG
jgi:hypothetical protein